MENLFEHYEKLPENIQGVIDKYGDFGDNESCEKFLKEIEALGYTCNYGLDMQPYELTKI